MVEGARETSHIGVMSGAKNKQMSGSMEQDGQGWRTQAEKVAGLAAQATTPVVFLLGAGCSLKSGGPTDRQVQEAVEGLPGRQRTGEALGRHVPGEAQALALRPLFEDVSPNVGYHCLAGLARKRRVYVLNLNFDAAVEVAASHVGVECRSLDGRDTSEIETALEDSGTEGVVVNVHLHGTVENARFTRKQKAETKDREREVVHEVLKGGTLIVLGTSLRDAEDLAALLKDGQPAAAYYFNRADAMANEDDMLVRSAEFPLVEANAYWTSQDMDFDAFMLHFAGRFHGHTYDEFSRGQGRVHLGLPRLADTALPLGVLKEAMRNVFEHGIAVISGPPHVGKSIAGNIVSYCLALSADRDEAPGSPCYRGAGETYEVLADGTGTRDVSSILLLKPVERDGGEAFCRRLAAWREDADDGAPPIVVCCSDAELPSGQLPDEVEKVLVSSNQWYSYETLEWIGRRRNFDSRALDRVKEHRLSNPGTFLLGLEPYAARSEDDPFVAHYSALLERDRDAAVDCCLLRMAELTRTDIALSKVATGVPEDAARRSLLVFFTLEKRRYAALDNESVREAVDRYLRGNAATVVEELRNRVAPWSIAQDVWARWGLLQGTSSSELGKAPDGTTRVEFFPPVLSSRPELETLRAQVAAAVDAWDVGELCYEVAKNWEALRGLEARRIVLDLANDRARHGLYGLLEAVLYFGKAVHSELTSLVENGLWERVCEEDIGKDDIEVWLCADALYWRSPTGRLAWTMDWMRALEGADTEGFDALRLFEAAYHPDGHGAIDAVLGPRAIPHEVSEARAKTVAELVQWHFVHQSYARARIGSVTRRIEEKAYLCRTFYERGLEDHGAAVRLVRALAAASDTAGWGVHAGFRSLRDESDEALDSAICDALGKAEGSDSGVVTAAMGYPLANRFTNELSAYFRTDANREFLLDSLGEGVLVDGVRVCEPRFEVLREPGRVLAACGVSFNGLRERGIGLSQWPEFEDKAEQAARELFDLGAVGINEIRSVLPPALRGDLRALEATRPARAREPGEGDPLAHAIQMVCLERRGQSELPFE